MDRVIVAFGPELLVLTAEEFAVARQRGRELVHPTPAPASTTSGDDLVTARQLATELNVAISAIYEHAKSGRIPSVRIGKHVRFDRVRVRESLRTTGAIPVGRR